MNRMTKLCHAAVGSRVRLVDASKGMAVGKDVFIVCAKDHPNRRPARVGMTHGLYDDERELFLLDAATGVSRPMPHLSSLVEVLGGNDALDSERAAVRVDEPRTRRELLDGIGADLTVALMSKGVVQESLVTGIREALRLLVAMDEADKPVRYAVAVVTGSPADTRKRFLWATSNEADPIRILARALTFEDALSIAKGEMATSMGSSLGLVVLEESEQQADGKVGGRVVARLSLRLEELAGACHA